MDSSSIITMVLQKLIGESKRVCGDENASIETSPLKDILLKIENADLGQLKNLDFQSLLGGDLSGLIGSVGGMLMGSLFGKKDDNPQQVYANAQGVQEKLASLGAGNLSPERSRIVGVLEKAISFLVANKPA